MSWPLPPLTPLDWVLIILASILVGIAKTGLPGVGIISVALFTLVWKGKESFGIILLILICADCVAIASYSRKDARWDHIRKLFPWAAVGVALGTVATKALDESQMKRLIGATLLFLIVLQLVLTSRRQKIEAEMKTTADEATAPPDLPYWLVVIAGISMGFTTMTANASGPIMVLYLLNLRLPKTIFVSTTAWFFFLLNPFKIPFGISAGVLTWDTARMSLTMLPCAVVGGLMGKFVLKKIPQKAFEYSTIALTAVAAVKLLIG